LTEIYRLSGMKSFRDDLNDRMKTGWGRFVLASFFTVQLSQTFQAALSVYLVILNDTRKLFALYFFTQTSTYIL
jgi:hypothetical protein